MDRRRRIANKWEKQRLLEGVPALRGALPETRLLNPRALQGLLNRYGLAYVKPVIGSLGVGVIRAERTKTGYRLHSGTVRAERRTFGEAYEWIVRRKRPKPYLAQRGIRVLRRNGRPVDFRVVIQRDHSRRWEVTGMLARVAHPLKAVTNGRQGGTIYPAERLLRSAAGRDGAARAIGSFRRLALLTAARFGEKHPLVHELGLDIAVDTRGRCWILEVNTSPDPTPFTLLPDRSMLRRIVRLGKANGRTYRLKATRAKRG